MGPSGRKLLEIIVWEKNLSLKKKKRANARFVSCRFVDNPAATERMDEWIRIYPDGAWKAGEKNKKKFKKNSWTNKEPRLVK